jgi:xylulokinase
VCSLLAEEMFGAKDVAAIALSGQIRSLVLADARGASVGPAMLWYDQRWDRTAESIRRTVPDAPPIRLGPRTAVSKLLWVREHQPDRYAAAAWILSPKDYVKWHLCGAMAGDPSDASGTGLLDVPGRRWSRPLVEALGVDIGRLPPLIESTARVGALTRAGARSLGLLEGTPVVQGGSDNACAALGTGVLDGDDALVGLGTSGIVLAGLASPRPTDPVELWCHAAPDRWYAFGFMLTGGRALDWAFASLFSLSLSGLDGRALLREALALSPEPTRPLFLPYLGDENGAGAGLLGLRATHTRADIARAILDGIALALRDQLECVRAAGIPVSRAVAAGPLVREPGWLVLLAAALGVPVVKPEVEDATELGAATLAATGCGLANSIDGAVEAVFRIESETMPDESDVDCYAGLADRFSQSRRPTGDEMGSAERPRPRLLHDSWDSPSPTAGSGPAARSVHAGEGGSAWS